MQKQASAAPAPAAPAAAAASSAPPVQAVVASAANKNRESWKVNAGDIARLHIVSEPAPAPTADEVQISVKAVGLNFAE